MKKKTYFVECTDEEREQIDYETNLFFCENRVILDARKESIVTNLDVDDSFMPLLGKFVPIATIRGRKTGRFMGIRSKNFYTPTYVFNRSYMEFAGYNRSTCPSLPLRFKTAFVKH